MSSLFVELAQVICERSLVKYSEGVFNAFRVRTKYPYVLAGRFFCEDLTLHRYLAPFASSEDSFKPQYHHRSSGLAFFEPCSNNFFVRWVLFVVGFWHFSAVYLGGPYRAIRG